MNAHHADALAASHAPPEALCGRWLELCSQYLPLGAPDSIWRYSRAPISGDLRRGWKLHISATILTANEVLAKVAPLLTSRGTMFKAPASLQELNRINCGLYYGFSQVGKFITVYPQSDMEALALAARLDELTNGMNAPPVPFDLPFRPGSCVYYRYGSFEALEIENPDGTRTPAMRDPFGNLVPDVRDGATAKPEWATDPFVEPQPTAPNKTDENSPQSESPLQTTYRAYRALAQRGRGGVYEAVDLSVSPPRLCILKEGRRSGEVSWDGRDGFWRVRHEEQVNRSLRAAGVEAPRVYASFETGSNYYLVTELIEGETLQDFLRRRRRRLRIGASLEYGLRLASLLSRIHAAGWAWRDCKPGNVIITKQGELRPLDFEGACPVNQPDRSQWGTPAFIPPEHRAGGPAVSRVYDDLYALGATLYFILSGKLPDSNAPVAVEKLRRNVPPEVCRLIAALLDADPRRRPHARAVARRLRAALSRSNAALPSSAKGCSPSSCRKVKATGRAVGRLSWKAAERLSA